MRRLFVCFALLTSLALLWPSVAVGQKGKGKPKIEQATAADYAYLRKMKDISGTLTAFDPEAKTLTLRVQYQTAEPIPLKTNPRMNQQYNNLVRQQQRLAADYQRIMMARNPRQQAQQLRRFQQDYQRLQAQFQRLGYAQQPQYKAVTHTKDFDFEVAPEPKVARATPPMEYDDKGDIKKYTKEELKKMRDPNMPGYTAKVEDLQAGQVVKLYLGKTKAKKTKTTTKKKTTDDTTPPADEPKASSNSKNDLSGLGGQTGPQLAYVRQILIVNDSDPNYQPPQPKGRKGKKNR